MVENEYRKTMNLIVETVQHFKTKQDILLYLDMVKVSLAFTIKTTKITLKGHK